MATVKKRTWINANGKQQAAWVVGYQDRQGNWQRIQKKTRDAAMREKLRIETELAQGTHVADRDSMTVGQALDTWLADYGLLVDAGKRERSTLKGYKGQAAHIHGHAIASLKLSRLTAPDCAEFGRWLEHHRTESQNKRVLNLLRMVLGFGVTMGWCASNPAAEVKARHAGDRHDDAVTIPAKQDLRALLDASKDHSAQAHAMVSVLLFCGLRASELRGLPRSNVQRHELKITQRADPWQRIGSPKSKTSRRTIPVPPGIWQSLATWMLQAPKSDLVFPNGAGRPESYANIWNRIWRPLMASAGLVNLDGSPLFGLHTLRHACVSLWIEQGVTPKQVSAWAGHSSVAFTLDTYGHLWPQSQTDRQVAAAIENAL